MSRTLGITGSRNSLFGTVESINPLVVGQMMSEGPITGTVITGTTINGTTVNATTVNTTTVNATTVNTVGVNATGNVVVVGTLDVTGDADFDNDVAIGGELAIVGDIASANISATGNVTASGAVNGATVVATSSVTSPAYSFGGQTEAFNVLFGNGGVNLSNATVSLPALRNYSGVLDLLTADLDFSIDAIHRVVITHTGITAASNFVVSAAIEITGGGQSAVGVAASVIDIRADQYTVRLINDSGTLITAQPANNQIQIRLRVSIFQ